jgi:hypothetical protein
MTDYDTLARAFPGLREAGGNCAIAILVEGDLAEAVPDWPIAFARMLTKFLEDGVTETRAMASAWRFVLADYDSVCAERDRQRAAEEAETKRIDDIVRAAVLRQQQREEANNV